MFLQEIISTLLSQRLILLLLLLFKQLLYFFQLEKAGKQYGAGLLKLQRYDIEGLKFPDITLFSNSEIEQLKVLSRELVFTGNEDLIGEITKIIAKYS